MLREMKVPARRAGVDEFRSWQLDAACRGMGESLFFSPDGERGPRKRRRERAAKAVCARCRVREVCAAYAVATGEPYGTWGGMSERERRELLARIEPDRADAAYRSALERWATSDAARPLAAVVDDAPVPWPDPDCLASPSGVGSPPDPTVGPGSTTVEPPIGT